MYKRGYPEAVNSYSPVLQWATVRLIFIFQCILGFQSQIIYFANAFYQEDIPSGEPVFIKLPRDYNIDGVQCDVVIRLRKAYMVKPSRTPMVRKFEKWFVRARFCDEQGG